MIETLRKTWRLIAAFGLGLLVSYVPWSPLLLSYPLTPGQEVAARNTVLIIVAYIAVGTWMTVIFVRSRHWTGPSNEQALRLLRQEFADYRHAHTKEHFELGAEVHAIAANQRSSDAAATDDRREMHEFFDRVFRRFDGIESVMSKDRDQARTTQELVDDHENRLAAIEGKA